MARPDPAPRAPGAARPPADAVAPSFATQVALVLFKDLRLEWRSREIVYTMVFFAVLVVLVFSFAFAREGRPMHDVAGGILWVVVAFAGTLGLSRFFEREREGQMHLALLLCPGSRAAIYVGKVIGVVIFILATEAVALPLLVVLFGLAPSHYGLLAALLGLGTLGFAAVGALFGASLMQSRGRDVLLSIVLFPIVTPVIIAGAKGTAALLGAPADPASALVWIKVLAAFDLVFVTLSLWAFEPLARPE